MEFSQNTHTHTNNPKVVKFFKKKVLKGLVIKKMN